MNELSRVLLDIAGPTSPEDLERENAALYGWAFKSRETETRLSNLIGKRHRELHEKSGFRITASHDPSDYNCTTYRGTATADFSDGDIAILCDRGNCCFGAHVTRNGENFTCKVSTD